MSRGWIYDVIWDRYLQLPTSLEDFARSKRRKGVCGGVRPDPRIPGDWTVSLRVDENKQDLFLYRSSSWPLLELTMEKYYLLNMRKLSLTITEPTLQIYYLACMKKLHAADATRRGYTHVMVRTVDTDVVVIAVAKFQYIFLSKLWIEFGVGKHLKYLKYK